MCVWGPHNANENPGQVWQFRLICHPELRNEIGPEALKRRIIHKIVRAHVR